MNTFCCFVAFSFYWNPEGGLEGDAGSELAEAFLFSRAAVPTVVLK